MATLVLGVGPVFGCRCLCLANVMRELDRWLDIRFKGKINKMKTKVKLLQCWRDACIHEPYHVSKL